MESIFDISIAAYLLNPLQNTYDYDDIAREYLGMNVPAFDEIFPKAKKSETPSDEIPENILKYACYNAYVAYKAKDALTEKLKETEMLDIYDNVEIPLTYALYDMEQAGIMVAGDKLKEYGERLKTGIEALEKDIFAEAGHEFNINSPKQLGEILFGEMQLPGGKKTKTGYSTSASVLEKLEPDYPFVSKILEYRQLTKLKSTYADGLAVYIGEDNRIHGKFNQTITATGRISSTEPNLQNIPVRMPLGREIRKVFIPKEGCVFIDADYSQIELRILAHMSDDKNLIDAYNHSKDIHAATASLVFHVPLEEVTKEQRSNAKAVNFGIVYGISSFGLSNDLSISRKEAEQYIKDYFISYPGIKNYLDNSVKEAKEKGYSVTMFGRRRPIPELTSGNFMQRQFGERVAMNSPIQGSAADIMKIAMINVAKELKRKILEDGYVINENVLRVDSFLNHQIDVELFNKIADAFYERYNNKPINKIVTIEASGIGLAVVVAQKFNNCHVVFTKKGSSAITDNDFYTTEIHSYTKNKDYIGQISKKYLSPEDHVLIVDDFLANGEAVMGMIDLCHQAGATVEGIGIVVEKGFQQGRHRIEEAGYEVQSLAIVKGFEDGKVILD